MLFLNCLMEESFELPSGGYIIGLLIMIICLIIPHIYLKYFMKTGVQLEKKFANIKP